MAKPKLIVDFKCNTVGDLLDELSRIAEDPDLWDVMGSSLETTDKVLGGFRITQETLSDKSKVLNFELYEFEV